MNKPNVLLLSIDSLRYDYFTQDLAPNMSNFGETGCYFTQAISPGPYTRDACPALISSDYPSNLNGGIPSGHPTAAEVLRCNGYNTAAFTSNYFLSENFGYNESFDLVDSTILSYPWNQAPKSLHKYMRKAVRGLKQRYYLPASALHQKALKWIDHNKLPFFIWIHYMDTHGPYQSEKVPYRKRVEAKRVWKKAIQSPKSVSYEEKELLKHYYKQRLKDVDKEIYRFLDNLEDDNLLKETIILITADHGEEFKDHGLYSHHGTLYDELIHVPLLISGPGIPGDEKIDQVVSLLDLAPTILEIADTESVEMVGESLIPLMKNRRSPSSAAISEVYFDNSGPHRAAVRTAKWKLIISRENKDCELYNLIKDPQEQKDVSSANPSIVDSLTKRIYCALPNLGNGSQTHKADHQVSDDEVRERLEDLGYL